MIKKSTLLGSVLVSLAVTPAVASGLSTAIGETSLESADCANLGLTTLQESGFDAEISSNIKDNQTGTVSGTFTVTGTDEEGNTVQIMCRPFDTNVVIFVAAT